MRYRLANVALVAAGLLTTAAIDPAAAQSAPPPASISVVHGIAGSDIGGLPSLPIDVSINGFCVKQDVLFGTAAGPFPLPPGSYTVSISPANTLQGCRNAPLLQSNLNVTANEQLAVVAAETASGPAAFVLPTGVRNAVPAGKTRFLFYNAANAPSVDVVLTATNGGHSIKFSALAPGAGRDGVLPPATSAQRIVVAMIYQAGTTTLLAGPFILPNGDRSLIVGYVVGSKATGSVSLVTQATQTVTGF